MRFWWAMLARSVHFSLWPLGRHFPYQSSPAQTHSLKTHPLQSHGSSSRYIQQHRGSQGSPANTILVALFSCLLLNSDQRQLHCFELDGASCIINTHPFPSARFREHFCLPLAWLGTMKPNKVGLEGTPWDHLIHYPFPKAYRVNNGATSLQTPAARLWKFGFS